uniref:LD-carboxypeptidase n=1 Tax=Panagrolaimus sp. ES5 TaxID=591445 RepID=A0AC34FJX9_9BILA
MRVASGVAVIFCVASVFAEISFYSEKYLDKAYSNDDKNDAIAATATSQNSSNRNPSSSNFDQNNSEFITLLKDIQINVVAPASDVDEEKMEELKSIKSLNLNIPQRCFSGNDSQIPLTSDEIRFSCLTEALFDDKTTVIWALRGGYSSAKLIPYLQKLFPKPKKEKYFIGFSDITALHLFFTQKWGWKTIYGSVISEILDTKKYDQQNFIKIAKIISGRESVPKITGLIPLNLNAKKLGTKNIVGKLTGGNLAVVETSLATKWQINAFGKILFLEDVNVEAYMVDRSLIHLKQAGIFDGVKAIIFGTVGDDSDGILEVLKNVSSALKIPAFKTDKFGHEHFNFPIIYNTFSMIVPTLNNTFDLVMKL